MDFESLTKDAQILMQRLSSLGLAPQRITIKDKRDYQAYLRTQAWQSKRKAALKRAGYKCQKCSDKYRLDVHHKTYERLGFERPDDLLVLCHKCHEEE